MKEYKVVIKEIVLETFEVEANSKEEAIKIGISEYYNGNFVLEPGEVVDRQISLFDDKEWTEF